MVHLSQIASVAAIEAWAADDVAALAQLENLDKDDPEVLLARGRALHARFLRRREPEVEELSCLRRAAEGLRERGDTAGEAEAEFWIGTYYQSICRDHETALPHLLRARELAVAAGDRLVLSCVERHLGFVELAAGRFARAQELLRESVRLRAEIGFTAGVAAGTMTLAQVALDMGEPGRARALFDEAVALAQTVDAQGVVQIVARLRSDHADALGDR